MPTPRTIAQLVEACRNKTRDQVYAIVDKATADCCPKDGTPEEKLYNAIYEEGLRLDKRHVERTPEPFRASMIAIGEHYNVQGMIDW